MRGEDGYELWLRYRQVDDPQRLARYRAAITCATVAGTGRTAAAIRAELALALPGLLGSAVPIDETVPGNSVLAGTAREIAALAPVSEQEYRELGEEGYLIRAHRGESGNMIIITGNTDPAVLRGVFHLLRLLQTHQDICSTNLTSRPRIRHRVLAHWDNLDGSIERGYAGPSLWQWKQLPETRDPRYRDYARACASIGINGVCLNNVNANAGMLTGEYLTKVAALAEVFRPYGLQVYLSPDFAAPIRIGGLATSDPRDRGVARWWERKVGEIYDLIPDFGGFQVKVNSEGRSGPQDYGATHADGANMLADALAPYDGLVFWRAFVYGVTVDADRAKCAYKEFIPIDGACRPNVFVQVKNGPIDFQPREPFHPLFGAMKGTPVALELQITQEYLGQSTHLVYLGSMWKEILDSDTFAAGPGSTVARAVDGSMQNRNTSSIVGVANTGSDRNWCGHHFAQANWYAFGRLAWDHTASAEEIADEWVRMTWSNDPTVVIGIKELMLGSWKACINYMTPLGLCHLMKEGHHYGPDPGFNAAPRPDWNNVYYHRADAKGVGFDRSSAGSDAVSQYYSPLRERFDSLETCPEELLLWFHHVAWDHQLRSGRSLWQEMLEHYDAGIAFVEWMRDVWQGMRSRIDPERHEDVSRRLDEQLRNAQLWQQVCIDYFHQFALEVDLVGGAK